MRLLPFVAVLLLATPAAAAPWSHPSAGFLVEVPSGWLEHAPSRDANSAFFTRGAPGGAIIGCTVTSSPLGGPPADPARWSMPKAVMADPAKYLAGAGGDRIDRLLGKREFTGADGFPGWLLWADVIKAGADKPAFKLLAHVLSAPNTQLTAVCFSPASQRPNLPSAAITEVQVIGASLRASR